MNILRDELMQAQKNRSELLKWKLVLVSALGALGLGFSDVEGLNPAVSIELVLCCIPFVCAYVDLLCSHHALSSEVIGRFIRQCNCDNKEDSRLLKEYEQFVLDVRSLSGTPDAPQTEAKGENSNTESRADTGKNKKDALALEQWALVGSSLIFCGSLVAFGFTGVTTYRLPIGISGVAGCLIVLIIYRFYENRKELIRNAPVK